MARTSIEWTTRVNSETGEITKGKVWNPITGCDKISQGCKNCYAETMSKRLKAMGSEKYKNEFQLTLHPESLNDPYKWQKPVTIFVNSMSDLFHKDIPFEYIEKVFKVMNDNPKHIFQVLTKRSDILKKYSDKLNWTPNIWQGVSVENSDVTYRIDNLRQTGAKIKFLSCEPLLSSLPDMNLKGIDWVIVGGESGPNARPVKKEWIVDIKDQCLNNDIAFFFKQWGGVNKKISGRSLDGRIYNEIPKV